MSTIPEKVVRSIGVVSRRDLCAGLGAVLLASTRVEPARAEPPAASIAAPVAAEVDAKLQNMVRKYGERLSPEQRLQARKILMYHQRLLDSVRSFPLTNSDAPATVVAASQAKRGGG